MLTKKENLEFKLRNTESKLALKELALEKATTQFLKNAEKPFII